MQLSHKDISEFYDYDLLFEELANSEPRSVAWRYNQRPLDDYEFSKHEVPLADFQDKIMLEREEEWPEEMISGLDQLLLERRSTFVNGMGAKWSLSDVSALLTWSAGVRDIHRHMGSQGTEEVITMRTYPSGGAMYSIKLYMYIRNVEGLEDGVYYYAPLQKELYRYGDAISMEQLERMLPMTLYKTDARSSMLEGVSILLFFIADLQYSFKKYGRLSYKLSLIESGHIAQNIQLVSTALKKHTLPICGFFADKVEELLQLREQKYKHCVYAMILG
ncbi:SagB/ThcOx family dehydrogenase [Paenibacillus sp. HJL G12]|uniref:SagB/ThcOx family dehydrogenase n=1 Tax=Paenibacillus dendrobii TaxID=2691084 RepID=A0A7X3LIW9_9BACL|nr:SagB family peptide dehydrogenase [Paenibacillus dendrobii]MWV45650.1 SagB/ThcOx family dehydrogenase [Paenibacillus dendrobii]